MSQLSDFFADYDLQGLIDLGVAELGIDLSAVYCLHTGKKIGTFESEELLLAIDDEADQSSDSLLDSMLVRCVASMRPSPALNKPDHATLATLAEKRPVDLLAYLVNRLNGNRNLLAKRDDGAFSPLVARIGTHKQWSDLAAAGVDLKPWIHWLLELDAKTNLHDLTPPYVKVENFNCNLFAQVNPDNHVAMLKLFESWVFSNLGAFDQRDIQLTREANWARGNTMTKRAFVDSWIKHPEIATRRGQAEVDKRLKASGAKPGRPKSDKALAADSRMKSLLALLGTVLDSPEDSPAPVAPAPVKNVFNAGNLPFLNRKGV